MFKNPHKIEGKKSNSEADLIKSLNLVKYICI